MIDTPADPKLPLSVEPAEFDVWLRAHLGRLHASVLTEPVPEHFIHLLHGQPG